MEIGEVLFYSGAIGVIGGLLNADRFGFYAAFAVTGGLCLVAGFALWATNMESSSFAIVMVVIGIGQIIYSILTSKK